MSKELTNKEKSSLIEGAVVIFCAILAGGIQLFTAWDSYRYSSSNEVIWRAFLILSSIGFTAALIFGCAMILKKASKTIQGSRQ